MIEDGDVHDVAIPTNVASRSPVSPRVQMRQTTRESGRGGAGGVTVPDKHLSPLSTTSESESELAPPAEAVPALTTENASTQSVSITKKSISGTATILKGLRSLSLNARSSVGSDLSRDDPTGRYADSDKPMRELAVERLRAPPIQKDFFTSLPTVPMHIVLSFLRGDVS